MKLTILHEDLDAARERNAKYHRYAHCYCLIECAVVRTLDVHASAGHATLAVPVNPNDIYGPRKLYNIPGDFYPFIKLYDTLIAQDNPDWSELYEMLPVQIELQERHIV